MNTQTMSTAAKQAYARWQKRHPSFDPAGYARWVRQRGYQRYTLDPSKPDFAEYATVYLGQRRVAHG